MPRDSNDASGSPMERALMTRLDELERKDAQQHVSAYDVTFGIEAEAIRRQLKELKDRPPRPPALPRAEATPATPRSDPEQDAAAVVAGVLPPLLELVETKASAGHELLERALGLVEKQGSQIERLEANAAAAEARYTALEERLAETTRTAKDAAQCGRELAERLSLPERALVPIERLAEDITELRANAAVADERTAVLEVRLVESIRAAEEAAQCARELAERLDAETSTRVALQADMAVMRERAIAVEARTLTWAPTFVRDHEGHLICSQPDGTTRDLGRVDGDKGERGADGVGFDAIDASIINERTICLSIGSADGLRQKEIRFPLPIALFRGAFRDGTEYQLGDLVHYAGSLWHCDAPTSEMPTERSEAWSVAARRGRDGAAGPAGPPGPEGKRGPQGERGPVQYAQVG